MKPVTREEQYLNRLTGEEQEIPEEPVTREEQYLARLCGQTNSIPEKPVTRREEYLANLCGEEVIIPEEQVTRMEQYMAFAAGARETKPEEPVTREEWYWDKYQGGDVPEEKTIAFTDIITVTDALARPAVDLQSEITATQNLNGYEYPWVGGAGKNKLDASDLHISAYGITYTQNADGSITANGTATDLSFCLWFGYPTPQEGSVGVLPSETSLSADTSYVLNGCPSGGSNDTYYTYVQTGNYGVVAQDTGSGSQAFTLNANTKYRSGIVINNGTTVNNLKFYPMVRLATESNADFAPYENICPISGRTEVNVTRTGKNLLPIPEWFDVGYSVTYRGITFKILEDGVVEVSGTNDGTGNADFYLSSKNASTNLLYLENGTYTVSINGSGSVHLITSGSGTNGFPYTDIVNSSRTSTVTNEAEPFFYIVLRVPSGTTIPEGTRVYLQYELGSTATTYEPYDGDTFNTELGRTVYGGSLDLTTGELKITHAIVDLGDLTWTVQNLNLFQTQIREKKVGSTNFITTSYRTVEKGYANLANGEATSISPMTHGHIYTYIGIKDERATTAEEFTTLVTGQKMVYELATPQTISLTPTEVMMLENNNTIWADAGRVQLTYLSKAAQRVQTMNASLQANALKLSGIKITERTPTM